MVWRESRPVTSHQRSTGWRWLSFRFRLGLSSVSLSAINESHPALRIIACMRVPRASCKPLYAYAEQKPEIIVDSWRLSPIVCKQAIFRCVRKHVLALETIMPSPTCSKVCLMLVATMATPLVSSQMGAFGDRRAYPLSNMARSRRAVTGVARAHRP